jgi:hypothetical protein
MMENTDRFYNAMSVMKREDVIEAFNDTITTVMIINQQQMQKIGILGTGLFIGFNDGSGAIMVKHTKDFITIHANDMLQAIEMVIDHESNEVLWVKPLVILASQA